MGDSVKTTGLTTLALTGFAANSLLCRQALGTKAIDPSSFTAIRILSGALTLAVIARVSSPGSHGRGGSWGSAAALFGYAIAFSFAYTRVEAGVGALVLFAAVQLTMVGWGIIQGERPGLLEWLGLSAAFGGLFVLTRAGTQRPDLLGALLMALSGFAWGVYSLRGRGSGRPLATTADNFLRAAPLALVVTATQLGGVHMSASGVGWAVASGSLASGVGYALWYAALPGLSNTRAAVVQLSVPVLAAAGGVALLGEVVHTRLLVAAGAIVGGIALAVLGRRRTQ